MEQILANIVILGSRYALATFGLSLIYRSAGYLDFGQGAMFVIGSYGAFVCASSLGLPLPAAILGGAILAGLCGCVVDQAVYRSLRRRQRNDFAIMLASLGVLVVAENCMALIFSDAARSLPLGNPRPGHMIFGARITESQLCIVTVTLVTAVLIFWALRHTRLGLYLRALGSDRTLLRTVGSPTEMLLLSSATAGSLLSGLAGGLSSLELDVSPMAGNDALLPAVLITLLGGAGSVWGALLAALLMAALEGVVGSYVSLLWREAIAFVIILAVVFVRPQGLVGVAERSAP